jgi:hypothetical protein
MTFHLHWYKNIWSFDNCPAPVTLPMASSPLLTVNESTPWLYALLFARIKSANRLNR